jgi:hypothetical protein
MKDEKDLEKEMEIINEILKDIPAIAYAKVHKINLDLAGVFYVNAWLQFLEGEKSYNKLQNEINIYEENLKKERENEEAEMESDDFVTSQFSKLRELEIHYEPVVRYFSTLKILLVCCAETFVNEVSSVALDGRSLKEFDKLSIVGKWIFIQRILKIKDPLDVGKKPFQDFAELVKERNKLVHFKGSKKSIETFEIPTYIFDLKLTIKDCRKNFESVKGFIRDFSLKWQGAYGPDWLYVEDKETFRNPCFYLGTRKGGMVLWSDNIDDKGD